jgi:hypothetical protein
MTHDVPPLSEPAQPVGQPCVKGITVTVHSIAPCSCRPAPGSKECTVTVYPVTVYLQLPAGAWFERGHCHRLSQGISSGIAGGEGSALPSGPLNSNPAGRHPLSRSARPLRASAPPREPLSPAIVRLRRLRQGDASSWSLSVTAWTARLEPGRPRRRPSDPRPAKGTVPATVPMSASSIVSEPARSVLA